MIADQLLSGPGHASQGLVIPEAADAAHHWHLMSEHLTLLSMLSVS
jgi:hypothetical protein